MHLESVKRRSPRLARAVVLAAAIWIMGNMGLHAGSDVARAEVTQPNSADRLIMWTGVADLTTYRSKRKTAGQPTVLEGAPGRIRTCAPASGGRCSIP